MWLELCCFSYKFTASILRRQVNVIVLILTASSGTGINIPRILCFVGCLTSQQHASVSQGRICLDNFTCCHTEIEVADQTFYLTQSQYTDTGPTSPSADPITTGAWQGSHWSGQVLSHWYDSTPKKSRRKRDSNPGSSALAADALTIRPTRRFTSQETKGEVIVLSAAQRPSELWGFNSC